MAARLPTLPRVVFTIFEPISLLLGMVPAIFSTNWFISEQIVQPVSVASTENARLVAQQLGNMYGLAAMVGIAVLYTSTELAVIRNYLIALWIADIGHIGVCYYVHGHERFMAFGSWNAMTWGNVVVTAFLCLTRTAYFLGFFGPDRPVTSARKKIH